MKQSKTRSLIGIASLNYNRDGQPINGLFKPVEYKLDTLTAIKQLWVPARTVEDIIKNAETTMASWLLEVGRLETVDREHCSIETEIVSCDKWTCGHPKHAEIAFYLVTVEDKPRNLTGVV